MHQHQFSPSWSISHVLHGHAKSALRFPFNLQQKCLLVHFTWLCEFSHDHAKWKYIIFQLFFVISSISFFWIHLNHLQINSKSRSKPIALLLSLCIWIFINFICSLQFDSSLVSPIYQNHTLKWLQNFIKLVSNSCKGNNMLIEYFKHNYYSKDVKLVRISI